MQVKTIKKKAALQLLLLFSILVKTKWYWQVVSNFKIDFQVQRNGIILSHKRYINMKIICFGIQDWTHISDTAYVFKITCDSFTLA